MTTISNYLSLISGGVSFRSSGFETRSDCFWHPGSGERLLEQTLLTDWPALPGMDSIPSASLAVGQPRLVLNPFLPSRALH
jgi:hypothetical protein